MRATLKIQPDSRAGGRADVLDAATSTGQGESVSRRRARSAPVTRVAFAVAVAVAAIVAVVASVACSGTTATPAAGDGAQASTGEPLPCDVDAVLAANCRSCHGATPAFGAPMPLVTFGDLHAAAKETPGKKVYEVVAARIHDDAHPMPQPPNARLTGSAAKTIDDWVAAGAPAGGGTCTDAGTSAPTSVTPLGCTPDQKLRPATKFAVTSDPDLYVCYGFDTEASAKRHVIAGAPHIDNTKVVHHVLLYQADATVSSTPAPCGAGGGAGWRLVTGWAPGGKNFELPPEAGFAEESGTTHWALQIHYNNAQALENQVDESGFDLCTTDQLRPNDADILATGTLLINIPARSTYQTTCDLTFPEAYGKINVISSWAHMHRLGRAQYAKRVRGGEETTLLDAPNYDFSTGAGAQSVNVELQGGDTVRTMCQWQNASSDKVTFGEATSNEMCFAFLTYYPKITQSGFRWMAPSLPSVSKCTSTTL